MYITTQNRNETKYSTDIFERPQMVPKMDIKNNWIMCRFKFVTDSNSRKLFNNIKYKLYVSRFYLTPRELSLNIRDY